MSEVVDVTLQVNGSPVSLSVEARELLADTLRQTLGLTGTHLGCEHGVCGACSVRVNGEIIRSCLIFTAQLDGAVVQTIEGLADDAGLHPVQQAFQDQHALQCGFCTPGFVMAAADLLERIPSPSEQEIREQLSGNICRCTGYAHIVRAVQQAAQARRD